MGKSNILNLFREHSKPCFIAYITAGDPDYNTSLNIVDQLIENGVGLLEVGIPFSDPLADGEVNQLSAQRALDAGMNLKKCLDFVQDVKSKYPYLPIVLYTYLNLVAYSVDFEEFCKSASYVGVDGLLILDLTPEESNGFKSIAEQFDIGLVALVAPTTKTERLKKISEYATSFIYYVSQEGVTGVRKAFARGVKEKIDAIKQFSNLPIVVGFGISEPEHVIDACSTGVNGVVVGSAIVKKIHSLYEKEIEIEEIGCFVKKLTSAIN